MAGRRPKPTHLKLLTGNPGKRPLNKREPKPGTAIPRCPAGLSPSARKEWRRISIQLFALGLLTEIDRAALAVYCQAWAQWLEATVQLQTAGLVVKAPSGYPILNPHLSVANQAFQQMKAILGEFGMTPSSRTRIAVTQENSSDQWDDYFTQSPKSS